jgi:hypothetical protein
MDKNTDCEKLFVDWWRSPEGDHWLEDYQKHNKWSADFLARRVWDAAWEAKAQLQQTNQNG